jgi:hypothetical protein
VKRLRESQRETHVERHVGRTARRHGGDQARRGPILLWSRRRHEDAGPRIEDLFVGNRRRVCAGAAREPDAAVGQQLGVVTSASLRHRARRTSRSALRHEPDLRVTERTVGPAPAGDHHPPVGQNGGRVIYARPSALDGDRDERV